MKSKRKPVNLKAAMNPTMKAIIPVVMEIILTTEEEVLNLNAMANLRSRRKNLLFLIKIRNAIINIKFRMMIRY